MFKTDLNERERRRYADLFRALQTVGNEGAEAIETGNDARLAAVMITAGLMFMHLAELQEIILKAMRDEIKRKETEEEEFPEIIG